VQGVKLWVIKVVVDFYLGWKKCCKLKKLFADTDEYFNSFFSRGEKFLLTGSFFRFAQVFIFSFHGQGRIPGRYPVYLFYGTFNFLNG
jgi:hypothetical protein